MSYMVRVKCNVSDDIFELSGISNKLSSNFHIEGGQIKERYEEIFEYVKKHTVIEQELLSYEQILMLFKAYVRKALINEAVQRVLDVERNQYDIRETLHECITQGKIREYTYREPMVRAFAHAIRNLPPNDSKEGNSCANIIQLIEKKFLNDHHI